MSWWCSAGGGAWSWTWRAYPGIWLMTLGIALAYWRTLRRMGREPDGEQSSRPGRPWTFALGVFAFWITTDWPIGTLGSSYLASVHMVQFQLYTLVVAPLLLLGLPEPMFRSLTKRLHLDAALPHLARPFVAGVVFNATLLITHAPFTVDALRPSQFGSFALDTMWLLSGFVLWLPIVSPAPELRHPSPAVRCVYLFLAAGALAMIPGAIVTFASSPLYRIYELAPRATPLDALDDQQLAGIVMKIGNLPVIWSVMLVIFVRWAERDRADSWEASRPRTRPGRSPAEFHSHPVDVGAGDRRRIRPRGVPDIRGRAVVEPTDVG